MARGAGVLPLTVGAALVAAGAMLLSNAFAFELAPVAIYGLLALSLVLVWGHAGIFSLGQAGLFGLGSYGYGIVAINLEPTTGETISALVAGSLVAAAVALVLGYFVFYGEVGDVYVGVITLAASLLLLTLVSSTTGPEWVIGDAVLGGYNGLIGFPPLTWQGLALDSRSLLATSAVALVLVGGAMHWLRGRRFGRVLAATVDNPARARLLGYDVRGYRLAAFVLGGAIAGLGGALFAAWSLIATPSLFGLAPAALVMVWVLLGGRTSIIGAVAGVAIIHFITTASADLGGSWPPLLQGAILIGVIMLLPAGLVPTMVDNFGRIRRSRANLTTDSTSGVDAKASDPYRLVQLTDDPARRPMAVEAHGLGKDFGGVSALRQVDASVKSGALRCVIGPNGAGKSTFFALVAGQLRPTRGRVSLEGHDITRLRPHQRARLGIGIKTQVPNVFPGLSVFENLWLASAAGCDHPERRAAEVTAWLGPDIPASARAGNLPHGAQQRLEIAMVMCAGPSVALLDEPTAGMTRTETAEVAELIEALCNVVTVIVVDHDMEFLQMLRADVDVFADGSHLTSGTLEELRLDERVLDLYLGRVKSDEVVG